MHKLKNKSSRTARGFTLVELAISLMIIGLLLGGVLKGMELIENARVTQMARLMTSYQTAVTSFRSIYNKIPGDMLNAHLRLPNCTSTTYCTGRANGDGFIGLKATADKNVAGWSSGEVWAFWQHLLRANLITGISTAEIAPDYVAGSTLPNSPMETIAYLATWPETSGNNTYIWFLNPAGSAGSPNNGSTPCAFKPSQVAQIDEKLDDGKATTGDVQGYGSAAGSCTVSGGSPDYNVSYTQRGCNLYFRLSP